MTTQYKVVVTRDDEGNWTASVPAFPGCHTHGATKSEALANAREAIEGCIGSLLDSDDPLPEGEVLVEVELVSVTLPAA